MQFAKKRRDEIRGMGEESWMRESYHDRMERLLEEYGEFR